MSYTPGDTLTDYISLVGTDGTPIEGATFPAEQRVSLDPNAAPFPATVTEMGQGVYRVEYTLPRTASAGEWFIKLRADHASWTTDQERDVFTCRWLVLGDRNRFLPGDHLTYTFAVLDAANADVTGETFPETERVTIDPLGNTFDVTFTEHEQGVYRATVFTAADDEPGLWLLRFRDSLTPSNLYETEWQLLSKRQIAVIYTPSFQGYTRRDLRRMVMAKVGDIVLTTATESSGSSTWVDLDTLVGGDAGRWAGREMLITSGTPANVGQVRYINASNKQGTLQFARELPFPVFAGDEAEIVNTRGGGFTFADVHNAINHCLLVANIQTPITAELGAFDVTTRAFEIPSEFNEIHTVQTLDPTSTRNAGWQTLHASRSMGHDGWRVEPATRSLIISGRSGYGLDGHSVRIYGLGLAPPLVDDEDKAHVDIDWLVHEAAAHLLMQAIGGPRALTPEWERKGNYFKQVADSRRDATRPRRAPNSVRV